MLKTKSTYFLQCLKTHLLTFSLLSITVSAVLAEPQSESKLSKEIGEINSKIQSLNTKNKERNIEIDKIEGSLRSLDAQLTNNSTKLTRLNRNLNKKEQRRLTLQTTYKNLTKKLQTQKSAIADQLRSAQINAKKVQAKSLARGQSLPQYLRNQHYFAYLHRAHNELIRDSQKNADKVHGLEAQLSSELGDLDALKKQVARQRAALNSTQQKQKTVVASLSLDQSNDQKQLAELAINRSALNELLEQLRNQPSTDNDNGFSRLQGKLSWPLKGKITKQRLPGVTILSLPGHSVHAIAKGRVVFAGQMRGFGLLAIVDHGGGYMSLYGQNQSLLVKKGMMVNSGEKISTSGKNQSSSQAGLYFEIRHNAEPRDPRDWCKDV
ncbi:MAG TPA: hypothetical protein DD827_04720 [Gammaproteobacteria bacterium]|jgi:septal ring factor EnvC (AmiA/AmiB activator)|nr:hypothetical protein [Gammaproteobacteria bacterium]